MSPSTIARAMADRRILVLACLAALVVGLGAVAGCGGDDDEPTDEADQAQEQPEEPAGEEPEGTEEEPSDGGGEQAAGDPSAGEQVFAQNCATCHGDDGGGTGQAPSLQQPGLDAETVEQQVRNGGGGMPPFEGQLSDQQIADVTAYVTQEIASE